MNNLRSGSVIPVRPQTDVKNSAIERAAREMLGRHGAEALGLAQELARLADGMPDISAAKTWREIAGAIERLHSEGQGSRSARDGRYPD